MASARRPGPGWRCAPREFLPSASPYYLQKVRSVLILDPGGGLDLLAAIYQGTEEIVPWQGTRRIGVKTKIENKHLLASSALPFLFPAIQINREYFGDGSMRQIAQISSAMQLGADSVLVIGVSNTEQNGPRNEIGTYPSLAQIAGHALNSIFLDSMEVDLERVRRLNGIVDMMPEETSPRLTPTDNRAKTARRSRCSSRTSSGY